MPTPTLAACAYVGPAPVPLISYVLSVEAQTIRAETPRRQQLEAAFSDISVEPQLFGSLGPAVNSGAGLFLYGPPGNGKSTLAKRITKCFGQAIWIPQVIVEDNQLIKLYDAAYHQAAADDENELVKTAEYDRRWIKVRRPTVIVGGELTMDSLEIRYDPTSKTSEAPIQLKSNCGCLLIDDFGRQRVEPLELLNRWIVPLENRVDFLTLGNRQEDSGSVRAVDHLLHEPGALRPGRRSFSSADSLQDRNRRCQRGGVPPVVPVVCQIVPLRMPQGSGRLPDPQALPPAGPPDAAMSPPRLDVPGPQLLRLPRSAAGNASRVLRARDQLVLYGRAWHGEPAAFRRRRAEPPAADQAPAAAPFARRSPCRCSRKRSEWPRHREMPQTVDGQLGTWRTILAVRAAVAIAQHSCRKISIVSGRHCTVRLGPLNAIL